MTLWLGPLNRKLVSTLSERERKNIGRTNCFGGHVREHVFSRCFDLFPISYSRLGGIIYKLCHVKIEHPVKENIYPVNEKCINKVTRVKLF